MGSNLQPHEGQYRWTFDITCAKELYQSYQDSQYWHLVESPPEGLQLNLVRAANSDRSVDILSLLITLPARLPCLAA